MAGERARGAPTVAPGSPCPGLGCDGTIIDDGYCDTCGLRPEHGHGTNQASHRGQTEEEGGQPARLVSSTIRIRTRTHSATKAISSAVGGGLVEVPPIRGLPAEAAVLEEAVIPENERFCANPECQQPVGRSRQGRPGRRTGHCPRCGQWFSFEATLQKGDLIGGQYEILGPIGHGGRGWVYVGRDRNVADRAVVVKGLLNAGDAGAATEVAAEMQYLAAVEHEHIVKIYNFVAEQGSAYIVMEYVEGTSLDALLRAQSQGAEPDPAWIERALAYVAAVLEALEYLHQNQIAYNDMKPENVMAVGRGCKLIDLGAAHRITDTTAGILATPGFYAPELADTGPTVATDLYTVGRTVLALVEPDYDLRGSSSPPGIERVPELAKRESLYRFVLRATDPQPGARFQSATEMRDQLMGVLRELVARSSGSPRPTVSDLFTPERETGVIHLSWRALPSPRPADRDPASVFVANLGGLKPSAVLEELGDAMRSGQLHNVIDTWVQVLQAGVESGALDLVRHKLDELDDELAGDWRLVWYRALLALADGDQEAAVAHFDQVYLAFPGEPAAQLGLAAATEAAGDNTRAAHLYDVVSSVDPAFTCAVFGLARCLAGIGEVQRAVDALGRIPPTSRAWATGRIAAVGLLLDSLGPSAERASLSTAVATQRLKEAGEIIENEALDPEQRARLEREVFDIGLALIEAKAVVPHKRVKVLARSLTAEGMRRGLEASYRELARFANTPRERVELVDLANFFRPTSLR